MDISGDDRQAIEKIRSFASQSGIDITKAKLRRTSSRFCLGVEHGDYNGTELFGVGTDRFIWMAYKPSGNDTVRCFSGNFPDDGVIEFKLGHVLLPQSAQTAHTWGRFPFGVEYVLRRQGFRLTQGMDAVIYGNIPGGGMSRSASLTLNLIGALLDANGIEVADKMKLVDIAQAVENDYIGSPCGQLDQIMILFGRQGMGTHYNPAQRTVDYVPFGGDTSRFRIVGLDTGTVRPGLEKSTYKVRRAECDKLVTMLNNDGYDISALADITKEEVYNEIMGKYGKDNADLCDRLTYIFAARKRFYNMLKAWKAGDIRTVGQIFRQDGLGLRDVYKISGPELETMCDIARSVEGCLGERMLGGGDKGAAGAIVKADSAEEFAEAIHTAYPRSRPELADKYAVHTCKVVDGVRVYENLLD